MNVIYCGCVLKPWLDVAKELLNTCDLEPSYWIGWNSNNEEEIIKKEFPQLIFHEIGTAWKGIFPKEVEKIIDLTPDGKFYQQNIFHELIAIKMMDRLDPTRYSFNFNEKIGRAHV